MQIRGINEIENQADELRHCWKSFQDLERLDLLDRLLDKYKSGITEKAESGYSRSGASDANFRTLAASVPTSGLIEVIGKHMDVLQQIYPRDYAHIMEQLRDL